MVDVTTIPTGLPSPSPEDRNRGLQVRRAAASALENQLPSEEIDYTTAEAMGAVWRSSNVLGSFFAQEEPETDNSPYINSDDLMDRIEKDGFSDHMMSFTDVNTVSEYEAAKKQLERELHDREIVGSMSTGGWLAAELAVGLADPTNYIPGIGVARKGLTAAQKFRNVAALTSGQAAVAETSLQSTQLTRTLEESVSSVALSAILGGVIGVGAARLSNDLISPARKRQIESELNDVFQGRYGSGKGSVGAAQIDGAVSAHVNTGKAPSNSRILAGWEKANDFFLARPFTGVSFKAIRNPETEFLNSTLDPVRQIGLRLFNVTRITADNAEGIANPTGAASVRDIQAEYQAGIANARFHAEELFRKAGGGRIVRGASEGRLESRSKYGDRQEFARRVYHAMINGDEDPQGDAAISELAKLWRKEVFAPILKRLQENGTLGPDVDVRGALSYVTRIYDRDAILKDKGGFDTDGSFLNLAYEYYRDVLRAEALTNRTTRQQRDLQAAEARQANKELQDEVNAEVQSKSTKAQQDSRKAVESIENKFAAEAKPKIGRRPKADREAVARKVAAKDYDGLADVSGFKILVKQTKKSIADEEKALAQKLKEIDAEGKKRIKAESIDVEKIKRLPDRLRDEGKIDDEAKKLATQTRRKLLGEEGRHGDYEVTFGQSSARGFEKGRSFLIPDEVLANNGYLVDDVFDIANRYAQTAGADAAMGSVFKRFVKRSRQNDDGTTTVEDVEVGDVRLEAQMREMRRDVEEFIEDKRERGTLTPDEERSIREELGRAEEIINERVEINRGTFESSFKDSSIETLASWARTWNFVRLMGGTVISSLADVGNLMMVNGFTPTIRHGVMPLMREYRANWGRAWIDADKLQRGEMRRLSRYAGANIELALNARIAQMAGIRDEAGISQMHRHFQREASRRFSKMSGITYWNSMVKQIAYNTTQARILDDAGRGWSKLSKKERAWLSNLGIDHNVLDGIKRNYDGQASKQEFGIPFARFDEWEGPISNKMRAALNRESGNLIVTPENTELPTFFSSPVGKMLLQFRSHMVASQSRIVQRNAQLSGLGTGVSGAAGYALGMMGMLSAATLVSFLKFGLGRGDAQGNDKDNGDPLLASYISQWEENPSKQFFDVLDRGTFSPIMLDITATMQSVAGTGPRKWVGRLTDEDGERKDGTPARLRNRSPADVLLGPTVGLAFDVATATKGADGLLTDGLAPSRAEFKAFRRLFPGQNVPGIQQGFNLGEMLGGSVFDWPDPK